MDTLHRQLNDLEDLPRLDSHTMTYPEHNKQEAQHSESSTLTLDGLTLRYACLSQRGAYPDHWKTNQDAFGLFPTLSSNGDAFFVVLDGHGQDGDGCAQFCRDQLPIQLRGAIEDEISAADSNVLENDRIYESLSKAHDQTNRELRQQAQLDASLSGTTAVSVYFHGSKRAITIANVGDSRAVLGRLLTSTSIRAQPLSYDQTPYRKDERTRIAATGARILSLDQLEGYEPVLDYDDADELGDPPRVWSPTGDFPGTTLARSLGDSLAEELGVIAQPELLTHTLEDGDAILVLATDGVWEFLTNQSVLDICAKFSDPLQACRAVVAEAYELWMQYEQRADDISILTIFIEQNGQ